MLMRDLAPQDAPAIAALWHAGGLESGARDPRFLPRMPVDDYASQIAAELEQRAGAVVPEADECRGHARLQRRHDRDRARPRAASRPGAEDGDPRRLLIVQAIAYASKRSSGSGAYCGASAATSNDP